MDAGTGRRATVQGHSDFPGAGRADTHSYCSGHMLMRVTGLQEKRTEGGRDGRGGEERHHRKSIFRTT